MKPLVAATARQFAEEVALVAVDAATDPSAAVTLGVRGVPTYIAFRNGEEQARRTGRMSEAELHALFGAAASGAAVPGRMSTTDRVMRLAVAGAFAVAGAATGAVALHFLAVGVAAFGLWDLLPRR